MTARVSSSPHVTWPTGAVERVCPDCVQRFTITADEVAFYRQLAAIARGNLAVPLALPHCRHWRR